MTKSSKDLQRNCDKTCSFCGEVSSFLIISQKYIMRNKCCVPTCRKFQFGKPIHRKECCPSQNGSTGEDIHVISSEISIVKFINSRVPLFTSSIAYIVRNANNHYIICISGKVHFPINEGRSTIMAGKIVVDLLIITNQSLSIGNFYGSGLATIMLYGDDDTISQAAIVDVVGVRSAGIKDSYIISILIDGNYKDVQTIPYNASISYNITISI